MLRILILQLIIVVFLKFVLVYLPLPYLKSIQFMNDSYIIIYNLRYSNIHGFSICHYLRDIHVFHHQNVHGLYLHLTLPSPLPYLDQRSNINVHLCHTKGYMYRTSSLMVIVIFALTIAKYPQMK